MFFSRMVLSISIQRCICTDNDVVEPVTQEILRACRCIHLVKKGFRFLRNECWERNYEGCEKNFASGHDPRFGLLHPEKYYESTPIPTDVR